MKRADLDKLLPKGYTVETWAPGDGAKRYRFFHNAPADQTYHGAYGLRQIASAQPRKLIG